MRGRGVHCDSIVDMQPCPKQLGIFSKLTEQQHRRREEEL